MKYARVSWPLVLTALLAACSGNLGGGQSTLPGTPQNGTNSVSQIAPAPAATPTPSSASNVATLGDSVAPQALPTVMGYGGSIAFPRADAAPSAAPNAKATPAPNGAAAAPVSIGITASTVEPSEAPHFNGGSGKRRSKRDAGGPTPLLFISLLATSDVTLGSYPKIAVNVPREVIAKHVNDTFALALFDPEQKSKSYAMSVAERDYSSPPPGSIPTPVVATPVPTPYATATPFGAMNGAPGLLTPPPVGQGLGSSGLPPERVAFEGTAASLTLKANRAAVFALYAIPPQPSPSPSPSPRAAATASAAPSPAAASSASPVKASPEPASPVPSATPSAKPVNT